MRLGIIYRATSPSGKVYIGSTLSPLQTRINSHRHEAKVYRTNSKFAKALRKYGSEIRWEILHKNIPENILIHLELYEIEYHDSFRFGYNSSLDGRSKGVIYTDERKRRQSEKMKGKNNPFFGKDHPPEIKEQIRLNRKKSFHSDEFKSRMRDLMRTSKNNTLGRRRTHEEKLNMSIAKTKRIYRIVNTLIPETYEVVGLNSFNDFTKHHWNRSGKSILNTKKFHCYKIISLWPS